MKQISSKGQCSLRFLYIIYFLYSEHRLDIVSNIELAAKTCCKFPLFSVSNGLALERLCVLQKLTWIFSELSEHCGRGWLGGIILKDPKRDPGQHCTCFYAIVMLGVVWYLHQMEIKSLFSTISMTWETWYNQRCFPSILDFQGLRFLNIVDK